MAAKINDYKTFPQEFDLFIKRKLGIQTPNLEQRKREELELRNGQIKTYIDRFLSYHDCIDKLQELNRATMLVYLKDGKSIKVFVTNTYYFTEYTLDKVMITDPAIDAIICSCPMVGYSPSAKKFCIESGIGLFQLAEFMGAIRKQGGEYLNYLLKAESTDRLKSIERLIKDLKPQSGINVYVFGSYLRRKLYRDIDLMLVYSNTLAKNAIAALQNAIQISLERKNERPHIEVASSVELSSLVFEQNSLTQMFP